MVVVTVRHRRASSVEKSDESVRESIEEEPAERRRKKKTCKAAERWWESGGGLGGGSGLGLDSLPQPTADQAVEIWAVSIAKTGRKGRHSAALLLKRPFSLFLFAFGCHLLHYNDLQHTHTHVCNFLILLQHRLASSNTFLRSAAVGHEAFPSRKQIGNTRIFRTSRERTSADAHHRGEAGV